MTDVRTFRAATMQEALDRVRRELGSDAVILHTRELPRRRLFGLRRRREFVEITAGADVNVRQPAAAPGAATSELAQAIDGDDELPGDVSPPETAVSLELSDAALDVSRGVSAPAGPADNGQQITQQLNSIQQMMRTLSRNAHVHAEEEVPPDLFDLYAELIDAEVENDLARELICRLKADCDPADIQDIERAKACLSAMVRKEVRCSGPITVTPGRRKTVALIGPTGVGKTTTIAKLAANFRLRDGIRMGLVTVDTYRIAAVEQLRTYAEIIDLPMKVVTSPREMRRAMDELAGLDLVLIDTAGRSPRDDLKIQELKSFLTEACVDEVHLVLSLVASIRSLENTAAKFATVGTTSTILTKLDEAPGMGALLSAARKISVPVSYLTTGQNVPDDIEAADPSRIAGLVLGQERLFAS